MKHSLGVKPLKDNLKRIEQSKCKDLKKFAIHLAKCLESSERELYELKTMIEKSNQKEFTSEGRFKDQILERADKLYKEYKNKYYMKMRVTRKNSLKIVLSEYIQVFAPGSQEFILLKRWYKEIEIGTDWKSGILKKYSHFLYPKKK